jgi:serine acetyltransferase
MLLLKVKKLLKILKKENYQFLIKYFSSLLFRYLNITIYLTAIIGLQIFLQFNQFIYNIFLLLT